MLKLRISTIGNWSKEVKNLVSNKVSELVDLKSIFLSYDVEMKDEDNMGVIEYINMYYDNLMSNKIGYIDDVQFREIVIWDTEAIEVVEDLMVYSPDNQYR